MVEGGDDGGGDGVLTGVEESVDNGGVCVIWSLKGGEVRANLSASLEERWLLMRTPSTLSVLKTVLESICLSVGDLGEESSSLFPSVCSSREYAVEVAMGCS